MASHRKERVSDLLLSFLAEEVRQLNDPRLQLVILTAVDVAPDLKNARVYWSIPPLPAAEGGADGGADEQRRKAAQEALIKAEHFLKRRIGEELELRYIPKLSFRYDSSGDVGSRIDALLKKAGF